MYSAVVLVLLGSVAAVLSNPLSRGRVDCSNLCSDYPTCSDAEEIAVEACSTNSLTDAGRDGHVFEAREHGSKGTRGTGTRVPKLRVRRALSKRIIKMLRYLNALSAMQRKSILAKMNWEVVMRKDGSRFYRPLSKKGTSVYFRRFG